MRWVADPTGIPIDWDQITVQASRELAGMPVGALYPAMSIQVSADGRQFKFRHYAEQVEVREIVRILETMDATLPATPLVGLSERMLCFEYIPLDQQAKSGTLYEAIGVWMGRLAVKTQDWEMPSWMDTTASAWFDGLERSGFFSRAVVHRARAKYTALRPPAMTVCINYWDAMEPNFGYLNGKALLLDEKHLRPGIRGIGLVKPRLFLPKDVYASMLKGYALSASVEDLDQNEPFLEFTYRTYALWFYLLGMRIGATSYDGNSRLRQFRAAYLDLIEATPAERSRDQFTFIMRFPRQNARNFWRRVKRRFRRRFAQSG